MSNVEQRINLIFLAKLDKTPSECFALPQQVYKEEAMSRACAFECHKRFREDREECEDDQRSGWPVTSRIDSNIDRVKQLVRADCRLTVKMISEGLTIGRDAVWKILAENLEMCNLCAKMVPKILSEYQRQQKFTVCQDITERMEAEPDLPNAAITGNRVVNGPTRLGPNPARTRK